MSKIYAKEWADRVYAGFYETYPRATALLLHVLEIDDDRIVHAVRTNQKSWENFKKCVKILNNWIISRSWADLQDDPAFWDDYYTLVKHNGYMKVNNINKNTIEALDTSSQSAKIQEDD